MRADEELEQTFGLYDRIAKEHAIKGSSWAIEEVEDFSLVPFPEVKTLTYTTSSFFVDGGKEPPRSVTVTAPLPENASWLDLWRQADHLIRQSGDRHHRFIEDFNPKGDVLELHCGS